MTAKFQETSPCPNSVNRESVRWLLIEIIWSSASRDTQHCGAVVIDLSANGRIAAACAAVPTLTVQGVACATLCGEASALRALTAASAAAIPYLSNEHALGEKTSQILGFGHDTKSVSTWWKSWRYASLAEGGPETAENSAWTIHSGDLGGLKCWPDAGRGQEGPARVAAAAAEIAAFAEETLGAGSVVAQNCFCVDVDPVRRRPIPGTGEWSWALSAIEARMLAESVAQAGGNFTKGESPKKGARARAKAI